MSQYANFYVKPLHASYLPIGDYSRSSELYRIVNNDLPYEEITNITESLINRWINRGNELIDRNLCHIDKLHKRKEDIFHFNNSAEEKYDLCHDIDNSIDEITMEIEELRDAVSAFYVFNRLIDAIRFEDGYNVYNYLYAGIEVNPNAEEVAE